MTGRDYSIDDYRVVAQRDGDWWVLGVPDEERPRAITDDRLLAQALSDLLGRTAAEPLPAASRLADEMLRTKAEVPARARAGAG